MTVLESSLTFTSCQTQPFAASRATASPRVWTVFAAWLAAVVAGQMAVIAGYAAVAAFIAFMTGLLGGDPDTIHPRFQATVEQPLVAMLLSLLPFQLGAGAVALFAAWLSKQSVTNRLGLTPQAGRTFGVFRLTAMSGFTLSAAIVSFIVSSAVLAEPDSNPISAVITDGSWWAVTLLSVILSVVPAIVEEALFRGYIQRRLLERWSPAVAVGLSTLLFAVVHADSLQHVIAVIPLGVVTGLLAYRTNSILPGMLVHGIHNAVAVGYGAAGRALAPLVGDEVTGLLLIGAVAVLGFVGLPAIVSLLRSPREQRDRLTHAMPPVVVESLASQAA